MNDQQFDQIFRKHLQGLEVPYDAASWNQLEQRLDMPFQEEHPESVADVDKAVYHTLERMEAPYQPAHWDLMEKRLGTVGGRRRILWWKFAEAAAILLLIGYMADWQGGRRNSVPWEPRQQGADGPVAAMDAEVLPFDSEGLSDALLSSALPYRTAIASANERALPFDLIATPTVFIQTDPFSAPSNVVLAGTHGTTTGPEMLLAALPMAASSLAEWSQHAAPPRVNIKPAPRKSHFYTFVMVASERNSLRQGSYTDRNGTGYSAGIGAGYRKGKWGVETGMVYAARSFAPKREVVIFDGNLQSGYYGTSLSTVEADIASIPVRATRKLASVGRSSLHAVAGLSANIAWQKSYRYDTVYFPGSAPSGQPTVHPDQQSDLRPPGRGVLEGGRLKGNAYLTADAGLRLEHPLGRQVSVFVEPSYRLAAGNTGIGPKASRLNGFSVAAGVMASL